VSAPGWIIIGNPDNRRVGLFQDALAARGHAPACVIDWLDAARGAWPDEPAAAHVRIDSPGERFAVTRELLRLGFAAARRAGAQVVPPARAAALADDHGRILAPRQQHLGFEVLLDAIDAAAAARPGWRLLSPTRGIRDLFDKRVTSRRYASLGVPVPRAIDGVRDRETLRASGAPTAFVKLSCGSSASCLGIYDARADAFTTTIEQTPHGWYNSRRLRRLTGARAARAIDFLLREGSQVEERVDKARLADRWFDCRVVVIAGEPAFVVVRQSEHEITNLHLGGARGDWDAVRAAAGPRAIDAALESCRRVAAAHGCLHVGVDLAFEAGFGGHRVLEANAFGDLLPNLRRAGKSVYEWEIDAVSDGSWDTFAAWPSSDPSLTRSPSSTS
jgi:hypothetical protein